MATFISSLADWQLGAVEAKYIYRHLVEMISNIVPDPVRTFPTHLRADRPILPPLVPPGDRLVEKEDFGLVEVPRPEFRPHDP